MFSRSSNCGEFLLVFEFVEDSSRLHSLCAKFTFSLAFLALLKHCNLEAMSILELIHSLQTNSKRPQARLKHLGT